MKQKIKKILPVITALSVLVPKAVMADQVQSGLGYISTSFNHGGLTSAQDLPTLLLYIINVLLFFAGIIAVLFIIIGGFWYITAQGNDEQAEKGRKALVNAIIGVVVVIMAYVIINVVQNTVTGGSFY